MGLSKKPLGELIELVQTTNSDLRYGADDVRGMTITKEVIPTKANMNGTALDRFIVVNPSEFIYNPRTHGKKIGLGYNNTDEPFIISWNNTAFRIKKEAETEIIPDYLYLHFNRSEWDREACFHSWGSSTEVFSWEALCEMPLSLPPIDIQKKYVDIYLGMQENLDAMTRGAEEMHNTCDAYMERLLHDVPKKAIGTYIELTDERNSDEEYGIDDVRGISIEKKFIDTKANMTGVSLRPYKVVKPNEFCYVTVTSRNGDKISIALNESADTYIVSSSYLSFRIKSDELIPQYLFMFLRTPAFDRFARFNSWGSAREVFGMEDLCRFEIPVPEKEIQQDIVNIFDAYSTRKKLVIELEELQKGICPVLIKGAVEEGGQQ